MKEKLLFITISSLATNPRLVKEFEVLKKDFQCIVICFQHSDWSEDLSKQIIERNPEVIFYRINRNEKILSTLVSKLAHKLAILFNPFFQTNLPIAAYASSDKTHQLKRETKKISKTVFASRIIAHNLGAFFPALKARRKKSKLQLDIEDYHPGELPYFNPKYETQNRILIMKQLLERADHVTYASPLIMQECFNLFENNSKLKTKSIVVNNSFFQNEFEFKEVLSQKVKFVWFSQNISKGRGLEQILPALDAFSDQVELHLIGNLYPDFKEEWISKYNHLITVHSPQPQTQLHRMLSQFDVGLALEIESEDYNRQICLTNKIWAYLQAGLYIFATDTPAQQQFIAEHPKNGIISKLDHKSMQDNIKKILQAKTQLRHQKTQRFEYAKQFSWDVEQGKLIS